jgi:hypothetical protein
VHVIRAAVTATLLAACGSDPQPPPDPCPGLAETYERERTRVPCESDADCVPVISIPPRHDRDESIMGDPSAARCTPATHRGDVAAVEAAAHAYEAAGCGVVVPVHSTCGRFGHGQHILCTGHRCEAMY